MIRFKVSRSAVCAVACLLGISIAPLANAQAYTFTDLGTFAGQSEAFDIDNAGTSGRQ